MVSLLKYCCGLSVLLLVTASCGKKDKAKDGNSGKAKLALTHSESFLLTSADPTTYTPTKFGVKILSVRLTQDLKDQNPVGVSPTIWVNPACNTKTSETTVDQDDGDVNYGYSSIDGACTDDMVKSYFELARSTDEVNADLNSQDLKVLPASYKYVSIDFCIGGPKGNNVSFQADDMTEPTEVKLGTCGTNSKEADPPIVVGEGESVVVSLEYSLLGIVYDYGEGMGKGENCYFSEDESIRRCVNFPDLKPSFAKAE